MAADTDFAGLPRFAFGDGPAMADELLELALAGLKTATCWAARDGALTEPGKRWLLLDGAGRPRAITETVSVKRMRFEEVTAAIAWAEGEGDRSLEYWRAAHRRYFARNGGFDPTMEIFCETFRIVGRLEPVAAADLA